MESSYTGLLDQGLLAPPLVSSFNELTLSTASLLANASSIPSGQVSHGSLDRELNSPMPPASSQNFSTRGRFKYSTEDMIGIHNEPFRGSCSLINDIAQHKRKVEMRPALPTMDCSAIKRLRHNSAPPKFPLYSGELKPLKFDCTVPAANSLPHPQACYVFRVEKEGEIDRERAINLTRQEVRRKESRAKFENWIMRSLDTG